MNNSFHNTTNQQGDNLTLSEKKAQTQEEIILDFFMSKAGCRYSPADIKSILFKDNTPLTSVRRAMTNLTNDDKLIKTGNMVRGDFGVMTHTWVYKSGIKK